MQRQGTFVQDRAKPSRYFRFMIEGMQIEDGVGPVEAREGLPPRDRVVFWRDHRFGGLECLSATFHTLEFSPHTHETFCVGAMEAGVQKSRICGASHSAGAGDFYFINPDVVHEGRPDINGYRYRMIYPSIELMTALLEEATGKSVSATPAFVNDTVAAPKLAAEFIQLHREMEMGHDRLAIESRFHALMIDLMQGFGGQPVTIAGAKAGRAVHHARDFLDAHFDEDVSLSDVSAAAGLSRAHLIRAFKAEFHVAPHAWLTDRRIREARHLLRKGATIADTAAECGFADQAHLTRHFKARIGVTPGLYRGQFRHESLEWSGDARHGREIMLSNQHFPSRKKSPKSL
jgi:AraC-like DNA-binding protein